MKRLIEEILIQVLAEALFELLFWLWSLLAGLPWW